MLYWDAVKLPMRFEHLIFYLLLRLSQNSEVLSLTHFVG